jgi:phosphate uptake regulator
VLVARNLERVADLATNIAEEVVFIAEARIIKHHAEADEDSGAGATQASSALPPRDDDFGRS